MTTPHRAETVAICIDVKAFQVRAVVKCAEEDHHFRGEIGEARQTNRRERAETEGESGQRHHFAETAEIFEAPAFRCAGRTSPAMAKSSAIESPCANIKMAAPFVPSRFPLAIPRKM